ncbi:MAG: (d)CMP kinase [Candidatus Endonucleobacter bathymodioli]|uniref:Cytidylate kinase n=1 Tax=Candidatus Endonucleibacter bathymodioli TaxID=539814 RepID=A0AA90P0K3_9GAMM|nr:(d)CMP kinase [Candidatus Endonucleobacter bathymodioli]
MNNESPLRIVTIDGPSGSGKGTISALLAKQLQWNFLDSGALYRLTALSAIKQSVDLGDESALMILASRLDVRFVLAEKSEMEIIILDGEVVGTKLRTEDIGIKASQIAALPGVRAALLQRQIDFAKPPGLVADGRDMGTVVFPEADIKFFLTATAKERAKRRVSQLHTKGIDGNFDAVLASIVARDQQDSDRSISPLMPAKDAIIIDSSEMGIDAVFNKVMAEIKQKLFLTQT